MTNDNLRIAETYRLEKMRDLNYSDLETGYPTIIVVGR